ncbi:hypothetical protein BLNAU_12849 [Blattamonas nauphoetae]|uniref:Uncharacterized protein n=1 Tax=Blattamonas nauphoetae TaxID=2049346 RepID=A0ABQ9XI67_9EUKA|nr:hypothetical protein BLNAU_12849 [Blattamonas nauphoetae]
MERTNVCCEENIVLNKWDSENLDRITFIEFSKITDFCRYVVLSSQTQNLSKSFGKLTLFNKTVHIQSSTFLTMLVPLSLPEPIEDAISKPN